MCQYYEITWKQLACSRSGDILDLYIDLWQSRSSVVGERVQNCQKNLACDQVRAISLISRERQREREKEREKLSNRDDTIIGKRWQTPAALTALIALRSHETDRARPSTAYLFLIAMLTTDINNNYYYKRTFDLKQPVGTTGDKRIKRHAQAMSADDTHHFQMFERRQDGLQIADDRHDLLAGQGLAAVQQVHHLVLEPLHRGGNRWRTEPPRVHKVRGRREKSDGGANKPAETVLCDRRGRRRGRAEEPTAVQPVATDWRTRFGVGTTCVVRAGSTAESVVSPVPQPRAHR